MEIVRSTTDDIARIFELYEAGTAYQKAMGGKQWRGFERSLIEQEIAEGRQYKLVAEGRTAG
ncbi:MAG TPA: hypothetical protein VG712_05205, partial [Gemmatimonadales bacterium]|nr:hypothetical protein [Gemmatimonadales bacterium]